MGTSIPPEPVWEDDDPPAERALWRWAVEQLPDGVLVLPNVRLTEGRRGGDAEIDLVLIDPGWGVLVVEVKGGEISYDERHGTWFRWLGGGARKEIRDPVQQSQRATSMVNRLLERHRVGQGGVAVHWAVAVPECRMDAPGGAYLPTTQLWDSRAADQLPLLFAAAQRHLSAGEVVPGEVTAQMAAAALRGRPVRGQPTAAVTIAEHEAHVVAHTESHAAVLNGFTHKRRVLVRGAAGTGKTYLALQAAARRAAEGDRVLLVCWNVVLGAWLVEQLRAELRAMGSPQADAVTSDPLGQVVVSTAVGLSGPPASSSMLTAAETRAQYHEVLPGRLTLQHFGGAFDTVVIDEAQDLTDLWVVAVGALVTDAGRVRAFAHTGQDLFGAAAALEELCPDHYDLLEGFRNSREIAAVAASFARHLDDPDPPVECVAGSGPPVRYRATTSDRLDIAARDVVRTLRRRDRLTNSEIAVLTLFANPYRGDAATVARHVLEGELVETNAATFKGMERPAVVAVLDLDPDKADRAEQAARSAYVAVTRARSLLTIVGDPDVAARYGFDEVAEGLRAPPRES